MMRLLVVRVRLALCASCCLCASGQAMLRADEAQRFLQEAPAQWKAYAKQLACLEGRIVEHSVVDGRITDSIVELKRNGRCRMYTIDRSIPSRSARGEYVAAHNDRYAFNVNRSSPGDVWVVEHVQAGTMSPTFELLSRPALDTKDASWSAFTTVLGYAEQWAWLVEAPLALENRATLDRLTGHKAFRIVTASLTSPGRLEIRFECQHPPKELPYLSIQRGTLVVDPDHYYCLRIADLHTAHVKGDGRTHVTVEYSDADEAFQIPTRLTVERNAQYVGEDRGVVDYLVSQHARYELRKRQASRPDEEFTLTAFGLTEPTLSAPAGGQSIALAAASAALDADTGDIPEIDLGIVVAPNRNSGDGGAVWWLWGLAVGAAGLAVACALLFLARRRADG